MAFASCLGSPSARTIFRAASRASARPRSQSSGVGLSTARSSSSTTTILDEFVGPQWTRTSNLRVIPRQTVVHPRFVNLRSQRLCRGLFGPDCGNGGKSYPPCLFDPCATSRRRCVSRFARKPLVLVFKPLEKARVLAGDGPPYLAIFFGINQAKPTSEVKHRASSLEELHYDFVLSVITERRRSGRVESGEIDAPHSVDHVIRSAN